MCEFYSCIITDKGKIYDELGVDSHRKLEETYGLRDNFIFERAKIEVIPNLKTLDDVRTWEFIIDEERVPSWWNDGYKELVLQHMIEQVLPKTVKRKGKGLIFTQYYENGQLRYQWRFKNGQQHGLQEKWYENGQLWYRHRYKNGQEHGLQEAWRERGQLWYQERYKNGQKHGLQELWRKNGQLWYRERYKNGQRHGLQEGWYENGQLWYRERYKNEVRVK